MRIYRVAGEGWRSAGARLGPAVVDASVSAAGKVEGGWRTLQTRQTGTTRWRKRMARVAMSQSRATQALVHVQVQVLVLVLVQEVPRQVLEQELERSQAQKLVQGQIQEPVHLVVSVLVLQLVRLL